MFFLGIDGCHKGWIVITLCDDNKWDLKGLRMEMIYGITNDA